MEGDPEESDEDVQAEGRPTVLWERCIQQSIFVDLSEDESLHLSDLEGSLALHLSQAESAVSEASIHLSGSEELSALDVSSSESSTISSQSEGSENKIKNRIIPVSPPRPDNMQHDPRMKLQFEDSGQNTSDEEQDDLPYDGDLGSSYFNQTSQSEEERSPDGRETVHASPEDPGLLECNKIESDGLCERLVSVEKCENPLKEDADVKQENLFNVFNVSKPAEVTPSCPADINQVLLRHFSQDELQQPGRLLEAETLPEVSLLESVDETVLSLCAAHNSTAIVSDHSVSRDRNSEVHQSFCTRKSDDQSDSTSRKSTLEEVEGGAENLTSASDSITFNSRTNSKEDTSAADDVNQEKAQEDDLVPRAPFLRARSFTEMKYGQGQVHYPLPDFSKVSSKVKIPKASSGQNKPAPQSSSSVHRAQSSPGMLDLISRVLEDSIQPPEKPYVFKDEDKQGPPAMVHHLQAEYDKLLTKYAEAENLIDQMRIGTNAQPSSELTLEFEFEDDHSENLPAAEESHPETLTPLLPPSKVLVKKEETISINNKKELSPDSSIKHEEGPSDGERMTAELKDIITQFMQSVDDFKLSINNMSMSTTEQQMMLRSLMEAQDQLERKYISKKEEHRALEMQNYMGLSRNTGTFDPNRMVEGDIFRIGMHIEDIKELIDKNLCEQISPPHSSSTPTPVRETQHEEVRPLCMPTPSPPPPPLLEGQSSGFSTLRDEMEIDGEKEEGDGEACEVGDDRLQQRTELVKTLNGGRSSCHSRSSRFVLEGADIHTAETEDETSSVISDVISHSNILAYLAEGSPSSGQTQRTLDSLGSLDSVLHADGECGQVDCFSLAVEVSSSIEGPRDADIHKPPPNTSASQRIVSPETDSGFGSSYLNQSGSGSYEAHVFTESVHSQHGGVSSTDSEGSCSNLQTAIHSVSLSSQRWASPHPSVETQSCGGAAAVERWVASTTKEPSVHLQGSEPLLPPQLPDPVSEPILHVTMDIDERSTPVNSCSCNREAILALQSEVSRLKKDLEEGLVQLPHLTQKMDNLTSRYRQDRQERRSKTRPRTQHRLTSNSVCKPSSSRQSASNLSCSEVRIEDWISSDMEPSRSKDSGDLTGSEIMLQLHRPPAEGRRGSSSVPPSPEFLNTLQINQESEKISSTKTSKLTSSYNKGGKTEGAGCHLIQRPQTQAMDGFSYKERWSLSSSVSPQKPLLQVNYGSSSSLPASYKVREPPLQPTAHHRKRSTQSDTALLPSNVYFQRTLSPVSAPSRTGSRAGRHRGSKEEEMSRTLDQAIEVALSMKRTTDRMAKRLSADLAKAKLHRRQLNLQPIGGRKHHAV